MFGLIPFLVVPQSMPSRYDDTKIGASQFLQSLHSCQAGSWLSGKGEFPYGYRTWQWTTSILNGKSSTNRWTQMYMDDIFHCLIATGCVILWKFKNIKNHVPLRLRLVMLNSFLRRPILTHIQSFLSPSSTHLTVAFYKLSSGNIQKAIENGDLVRGFTH